MGTSPKNIIPNFPYFSCVMICLSTPSGMGMSFYQIIFSKLRFLLKT